MKNKRIKISLMIIGLAMGYAIASYQFTRGAVVDEINDYQREMSIATRLLKQYGVSCQHGRHTYFNAYIDHAITRYGYLVYQVEGFPYYLTNSFTNDHREAILFYREQMQVTQQLIATCTATN